MFKPGREETRVKVGGKKLAQEEIDASPNINLKDPTKALINGTVTQPISVKNSYTGGKFFGGSADEIIAMMSARAEEKDDKDNYKPS